MSKENPGVTELLHAAHLGDRDATNRLYDTVYATLRAIARNHRIRWSGNVTMDTSAIVSHAFLKISGNSKTRLFNDRAHFFRVASQAMRQTLVNYADEARRQKRGGGVRAETLQEDRVVGLSSDEEILDVHAALEKLEAFADRQARVIECRLFGGLSIAETAEALDISTATVKRDYALATAWLRREMAGDRRETS